MTYRSIIGNIQIEKADAGLCFESTFISLDHLMNFFSVFAVDSFIFGIDFLYH